jgi:hypothetical protein
MDPAKRERLVKLLGQAGSSYDGEAVTALRLAQKLLREQRLTWRELFDGLPASRGDAALQQMKQRVEILERENARLRGGQPQPENHQKVAQWILGLAAARSVFLAPFEHDFLETVQDWTGSLTEKQRPIFVRIVAKAVRCTGHEPPA